MGVDKRSFVFLISKYEAIDVLNIVSKLCKAFELMKTLNFKIC